MLEYEHGLMSTSKHNYARIRVLTRDKTMLEYEYGLMSTSQHNFARIQVLTHK